MKPHILFICSEYPPSPGGGIGTMYQTLARALVQVGWQVTVGGIYTDAKKISVADDHGVQVWRIPRSQPGRGRYRLNMFLDRIKLGHWVNKQLQKNKVMLIESADYMGWLWGVTASVPRITRLHGADILFGPILERHVDPLKSYFERSSLRHSTHIVASSHFMTNIVKSWLKPNQRINATIYNMVDVDMFAPNSSVVRDPFTVASIATITPKKGVFQLLEAWRNVADHEPRARLVYYGRDMPDTDGSVIERLKLKIEQYELGNSVRFGGTIPYSSLCQVMLETGIAVFPSYVEAHPRAWLEAMSTGAPVVGSNRGPGLEVIQHNITGLIVDPDNVLELANAILDLLSHPDKAAQLGRAARQAMVETLSFEVILKQNIEFYEKCIQEHLNAT